MKPPALPALCLSLLLSGPLLALEGVGVNVSVGSGVPKGVKAEAWKEREFNGILYTGSSEGGKLTITPTLECQLEGKKKGNYLKLLASGGPLEPISDSCEYDITFPALDVKVVNNSKQAVHLSELRLAVEDSKPDLTPLPLIFSGYSQVQNLNITNDGWGRIEKADFEFDLLPTKPKGAPGTDLPFKRTLHRIDGTAVLSLTAEFEKKGVPKDLTDLAAKYTTLHQQQMDLLGVAAESGKEVPEEQMTKLEEQAGEAVSAMMKFGDAKQLGSFKAKDDGLGGNYFDCWLSGWMTYTWKEGETEKSHRVALRAPILILPPDGLGAPMPVEGKYEAMLQESGQNYALKVPVSHVVKPGGTTRFTVTLGVPKSSFHRFKLTLATTDAKEMDAGQVELKAFLPKAAVEQMKHPSEASEEEGE